MPMLWKLSILRSIRDKKPDGIRSHWIGIAEYEIGRTPDREHITVFWVVGMFPNDWRCIDTQREHIITITQ